MDILDDPDAVPRLPYKGASWRLLTRAEPVDIVRLVEILGERQVQLAQQMPKIIVAVDQSRE
jgi:hypothetical protein